MRVDNEEQDVESLYNRRADHRWDRMVVGDILERGSWASPDAEAIVGVHGAYASPEFSRLTYGQADRLANRVANALLAKGLQRGDRVLLYCDNSVEAMLLLFGIAKAGLVAAPLNTLLAADVIGALIERVEPAFIIADAELWTRGESAFAGAGRRPDVCVAIGGGSIPGATAFDQWIDGASDEEPEQPRLHADDVWLLLFTSGTTSLPKAVMVTHTYMYAAGQSFALSLSRGVRFESETRLLTFLPVVFHGVLPATLFAALFTGGTFVVGRGFEAQAVVDTIVNERPTCVWIGTPQLVDAVCSVVREDPARYDLSSVSVAAFSWGGMSPELADELRGYCGPGSQILKFFGQTEAPSSVRFWLDQWDTKHRISEPRINIVGYPNPLLAADIVDPDGRSLRDTPGVAGETVFRSPAIMAGYYRDSASTTAAFQGGWLHTGDSCMYDEDGHQNMVDRYKDIVKSGGETVSSLRVETVLREHPAVAQAAVVGVKDERWGEVVTAVLVLDKGAEASAQEIIDFCRSRLAGYETPKRVYFVDSVPTSVGGKIRKFILRDQLNAGTFDGREAQASS
jgi:acyl-CoA synthetase (AMP-forming)/AMP-acid ligase II